MSSDACARCGSDQLVAGNLCSTGTVRFRPDDAKFMTLQTADVPVDARMCADCGIVVLQGDHAKLRTLRPEHPAEQCGSARCCAK